MLDPLVYHVVFKSLKLREPLLHTLKFLTVNWNTLIKGIFVRHNR